MNEPVAGFESSESSDTDTCFQSLMGSPDAPLNESLVFLRSRVIPLFSSISAFWRVREATCILGKINLLRLKLDSSGYKTHMSRIVTPKKDEEQCFQDVSSATSLAYFQLSNGLLGGTVLFIGHSHDTDTILS